MRVGVGVGGWGLGGYHLDRLVPGLNESMVSFVSTCYMRVVNGILVVLLI